MPPKKSTNLLSLLSFWPTFSSIPLEKIPVSWVTDPVACARLRGSRVRGDWESANMKIKRPPFSCTFHFCGLSTI